MYNAVFEYRNKVFLGLFYATSGSAYLNTTFPAADILTTNELDDAKSEPIKTPLSTTNKVLSSDDLEKYPNQRIIGKGRGYERDKSGATKEYGRGQKIFYMDENGDEQSVTHAATSALSTTRATMTGNASDALLVTNEYYDGKIPMYIYEKPKHEFISHVYSYPISTYAGAHAYNDRQICLFFNKSRKGLDEVRIIVPKGKCADAIMQFQKQFQKANVDLYYIESSRNLTYPIMVRNVYSPVLIENLTDFVLSSGE